MKHKLLQVMMERDHPYPPAGRIKLDDAHLGGQCHPQCTKLTVVKGFRSVELAAWAGQHLCEGSRVFCDRPACFHAVIDAGCSHDPVVTEGGRASP